MTHWHDFVSNEVTPQNRCLLLLTKPQTFDAADDFYDVLVGYWNSHSKAFVAAYTPAAPANGQILRVHKWAELPDGHGVKLRPQVGL